MRPQPRLITTHWSWPHLKATATTSPAATQDDLSTPLGAMRAFNHALLNADVNGLKQVLYATTPEEQSMVSAMENVMSTVAQVKKAVVAKFGEKALADLTPLNMGGRPDASLNNANVQINGDHAEVFFSSSPNANSFELVKVGDQWRIAMGELFSPQEETPALVKSFEEKMNGQEQVLNEVLAALNAGKLQTVQEVREELIGPPVRQPRD